MEDKNKQFVDNIEWERYLELMKELLGRYHAKEEIANELSSKVSELNYNFSHLTSKIEKIDRDVTKLTQIIFIEEEGKPPLLGRVHELEKVVLEREKNCPFLFRIRELEKIEVDRKSKDETRIKWVIGLLTGLLTTSLAIALPRILDWIHEVSK